MMQFKSKLLCGLSAAFLVTSQLSAFACGPFFTQAVMVHSSHPDFPLSKYAAGNLGIVRPTFARSYLFVAYRYLQNKPLTPSEQKGAVALWNYRLLQTWSDDSKAMQSWKTARQAFAKGAGCNLDQYRQMDAPDDSWVSFLNCPDDAFNTAVATLKERIQKYGQASPVVKDWVKAQDEVFCHCASPSFNFDKNRRDAEPPFPAPAPESADALEKADRAYQIAAAHFYAQKYTEALQEFQAIAQDTASPWSMWAPYLMARTLVRQATTAPTLDKNLLAQADEQISKVLSNPALTLTFAAARKLRNFVGLRLHPDKTLKELSAAIQDPNRSVDLQNNLTDYTFLFDSVLGLTSDDVDALDYSKVPAAIKDDEMSDWIATFQSSDATAVQHALDQYHKTQSMTWLAAAITKVDPKSSEAQSLIAAATAVPPTAPAFETVFYRAALIEASRNPQSAKSILDRALARPDLPPSTRNLLLDERSKYASNLKEFVALNLRVPATFSAGYDANELPDDADSVKKMTAFLTQPKVLSAYAAAFFNTKATEAQLAQTLSTYSGPFPAAVRNNFIQAVWTRAFLLDDKATANSLTPYLKTSYPVLATYADAYAKAQDPASKRFAGIYLMLHNPGIRPIVNWGVQRETPMNRIDDYQDNWWPDDPKTWPGVTETSDAKFVFPQSIITNNYSEMQKLKALGSAATMMTKESVEWAKSHPTDPRVPEALALSVKATRFGPKDSYTTKFSKEAFGILHRSYPKSPWTAKTPYYY